MKDKYNIDQYDLVEYVKRNIIDIIWQTTMLSGVNVTYPDTKYIVEQFKNNQITDKEAVYTIVNLKRAWNFVLDNLNEVKVDWNYIKT